VTIEREYASQSLKASADIGQAYVNAEKVETTNPAAIMTAVMTVAITAGAYFYDLPHVAWLLLMPFTTSTLTLLKIRQWFRWFGTCKYEHEDFVTARRKVNDTLRRWRAAIAAQVSLAVLLLVWLILRN